MCIAGDVIRCRGETGRKIAGVRGCPDADSPGVQEKQSRMLRNLRKWPDVCVIPGQGRWNRTNVVLSSGKAISSAVCSQSCGTLCILARTNLKRKHRLPSFHQTGCRHETIHITPARDLSPRITRGALHRRTACRAAGRLLHAIEHGSIRTVPRLRGGGAKRRGHRRHGTLLQRPVRLQRALRLSAVFRPVRLRLESVLVQCVLRAVLGRSLVVRPLELWIWIQRRSRGLVLRIALGMGRKFLLRPLALRSVLPQPLALRSVSPL